MAVVSSDFKVIYLATNNLLNKKFNNKGYTSGFMIRFYWATHV